MTTIAEFLLARIAEDEEEARSLVVDFPMSDLEFGWYRNGDDVSVTVGVGRAVAECVAKRRVVERATSMARAKPGSPPYNGPLNDLGADDEPVRHPDLVAYLAKYGELITDTPVLRILAEIYAEHADYDEDWRI